MTYEEKLENVTKNIARSLESFKGTSIEEKARYIADEIKAARLIKEGEVPVHRPQVVFNKQENADPVSASLEARDDLKARLKSAERMGDTRELMSIVADASEMALRYGSLRCDFEDIAAEADDYTHDYD